MSRRPDKRKFRTHDPSKFIRHSEGCVNKVAYDREEDAAFEADIRWIGYYKCDICNKYHLTSKNNN